MKIGDMTLREFAEWCDKVPCVNCPFMGKECCEGNITPYWLLRSDKLDVEVLKVGKK